LLSTLFYSTTNVLDSSEWRDRILRQLQLDPKGQTACWLIGYAEDYAKWIERLPECASGDVPLSVREVVLRRVLIPLEDITTRIHHSTATQKAFDVHLLFVDLLGEQIIVHCAKGSQRQLIPVDSHVAMDYSRLVEVRDSTLPELKRMTVDDWRTRQALIQRAIGAISPIGSVGGAVVWPRSVLKNGEIVLLEVDLKNIKPLYWAKFGSPRVIDNERRNAAMLRGGSPGIRRFLYEVSATSILPADYTGVLISPHVTDYEGRPEELDQWIRQRDDTAFSSVLAELDEFFTILHASPNSPLWTGRPRFRVFHGKRFDELLRTRRCIYTGAYPPLKATNEGRYLLGSIRPRRDKVELHLEDARGRVIIEWSCGNWQWWLWRKGLQEGDTVSISDGQEPRLVPQQRRSVHLATALAQAQEDRNEDTSKALFTLQDALARRIEEECKPWLNNDLYSVWLHGDFHPRNVLLFPSVVGPIKLREVTWELKVIDLADAVLSKDDEFRAPMAFDYVTFEADAKATSLLGSYQGHEDPFAALLADERRTWQWCMETLPDAFQELHATSRPPPWTAPVLPLGLHIAGFSRIALWRHFSLSHLLLAAQIEPTERGWIAADAYAQSLFFQSIGHLEYLDPKNGNDLMSGLSCLAGATVALERLDGLMPPPVPPAD